MVNRKVEKRNWNFRTGTKFQKAKEWTLLDGPNGPPREAWVQWAPDSCARASPFQDTNRVSLEYIMTDRCKSNAASAWSRFQVSTREWLRNLYYAGTILKPTAPWTNSVASREAHGGRKRSSRRLVRAVLEPLTCRICLGIWPSL